MISASSSGAGEVAVQVVAGIDLEGPGGSSGSASEGRFVSPSDVDTGSGAFEASETGLIVLFEKFGNCGLSFRLRYPTVDGCDSSESGVDACAALGRLSGVDSSCGKKSSSSSSPIFEESLVSISCKMLGWRRRGLMVPRTDVSGPGVFWMRVEARLLAIEARADKGGDRITETGLF